MCPDFRSCTHFFTLSLALSPQGRGELCTRRRIKRTCSDLCQKDVHYGGLANARLARHKDDLALALSRFFQPSV